MRDPFEGGEPGPKGPKYEDERQAGTSGESGASGDEAPPPQSNSVGLPGTIEIQDDESLVPDFFAEQVSPLYGRIAFREAFTEHLNGKYENAVRQLMWLYDILGPETPRVNNSSEIIDADDPKQDIVPDHKFQDLRRQTILQLKRLELGLNAYGDPPTFVPVVTYQYYKDYVDRWLVSARRIELVYQDYANKDHDQTLRLGAVKRALNELGLLTSNLQQDLTELERSRKTLQDDIASMVLSIQAAATQLMSASREFQQAIEIESGGCGFEDVLKGIQTVCTVGSGVIAVGSSIGPLIKTIRHRDDKKFKVYANDIITRIESANGTVNGLKNAYNDLAEKFKQGPLPYVPNDAARILANKSEVDETIRKFRSLPESRAYQNAIDNFVALVQSRNSKIHEHDALVTQAAEKESAISQAKSDEVAVRRSIALTNDPTLPEFVEFMERTLDVYKTEIVRSIFFSKRALQYITLGPDVVPISRDTVEHLEFSHNLIDRQLLRAYELRGREHQILDFGSPIGSFALAALIGKDGLQSMKEGHSVDFVIPDDAFRDFNHVFATRVRVQFLGMGEDADLGLRLVHVGHAKFYDSNGAAHEFTHASRSTTVYQNATHGSSLGEGAEFIALTPYGPWRADINLFGNRKFDFANLQDIRIEFRLRFLSNRNAMGVVASG